MSGPADLDDLLARSSALGGGAPGASGGGESSSSPFSFSNVSGLGVGSEGVGGSQGDPSVEDPFGGRLRDDLRPGRFSLGAIASGLSRNLGFDMHASPQPRSVADTPPARSVAATPQATGSVPRYTLWKFDGSFEAC